MVDNTQDVLASLMRERQKEREESEYTKQTPLKNNAKEIVNIPYREINPSIANNDLRSMADSDLRILADSIEQYGIKDPLRVYKDDREENGYKYIILSGHRRYNAWRMLIEQDHYNPISTLPCIVCEKPKDEITEKIDIAQSNITRRTPADLNREVKIANDIWNRILDAKRQDEYIPKLKQSFKDRYKDNQIYLSDPERYEKYHYRSRIEFIRAVTGLEWTNKTVQRAIKKCVSGIVIDQEGKLDEDPVEVAEKEAKKNAKKVTNSTVRTKLDSVLKILERYVAQYENTPELQSFIKEAERLRDFYFIPVQTNATKNKVKETEDKKEVEYDEQVKAVEQDEGIESAETNESIETVDVDDPKELDGIE